MNVLVIGAGNMGAAFVKQLRATGHDVSVTSRTAERAAGLASRHDGVQAIGLAGAADHKDVIVLAVPFSEAIAALRAVGDLNDMPIIDITNPLTADYMGLTLGHSTSAAEEIARAVPQALLVKGFNTLFAQVLAGGAALGNGRSVSVFLASDSYRGKKVAAALATSLGFDVIDAGPLINARYLEPLAGLNVYLGYGAGLGTSIAPAWVHRA